MCARPITQLSTQSMSVSQLLMLMDRFHATKEWFINERTAEAEQTLL